MHSTQTQAILISSQLVALSQESLSHFAETYGELEVPSVHLVPPYVDFLDLESDLDPRHVPPPPRFEDAGRDAVILHSSGSTGQYIHMLSTIRAEFFWRYANYQVCRNLSSTRTRTSLAMQLVISFRRETLKVPSMYPPYPCTMCAQLSALFGVLLITTHVGFWPTRAVPILSSWHAIRSPFCKHHSHRIIYA